VGKAKSVGEGEHIAPLASPPLKRKREDAAEKKPKKNKSSKKDAKIYSDVVNDSPVLDQESRLDRDGQNDANVPPTPNPKGKSKNTKSAKSADEASDVANGSKTSQTPVDEAREISKKEKRKKRSAKKEGDEAEDDDSTVRHAGVFSKFQKALGKAVKKMPADGDDDVDMDVVEEPELHG